MAQTLFSREELEASKGAVGRIVRIVGPVVDVEFPADQIPSIYNALTVDTETQAGEIHLVLEVETHLPGNLVRSVSMSSTDGLIRGLDVQDTGHPIMMPVGPKTLGRIWNVIGEPVDEKPLPDELEGYMPIHRPAPEYEELTTTTEIFETGIRDRHQGHRPDRAVRPRRQDGPVRRRRRRQDGYHSGAHQQPRPRARRHVGVHGRRRAHP